MSEQPIDFSQRRRQNPAAIPLILLNLAQQLIRRFWPIVIILLVNPRKIGDSFWTVAVLVVAFGSAISSLIAYFRFYFHLEGRHFIVEKGALQRSRIGIPLERIQSVQLHQPFLHRLLGVVQVDIDTAGSAESEISIRALSYPEAKSLKNLLLSGKQETQVPEPDQAVSEPAPAEKQLLALSIKDLLLIGLTQNHLRTAMVLLGLVYGLYWQLDDLFGKAFREWANAQLPAVWQWMSGPALLLIVIPLLLLAVILTMTNTVLRFYQLSFVRRGDRFEVGSGLLNHTEQAANLPKIQRMSWSATLFQRRLRWYTLRLWQAGSETGKHQALLQVPGARQQQIYSVGQAYFPEIHEAGSRHTFSRYLISRRVLYGGFLPALAATLLSWNTFGIYAGLCLLWIPWMYWYNRRYQQLSYLEIKSGGLQLYQCAFGESTDVLIWSKIQGITIQQSPFQRRKSIADLTLHTAGGNIAIPYLDLALAQEIMDFGLYEVEAKDAAWM